MIFDPDAIASREPKRVPNPSRELSGDVMTTRVPISDDSGDVILDSDWLPSRDESAMY